MVAIYTVYMDVKIGLQRVFGLRCMWVFSSFFLGFRVRVSMGHVGIAYLWPVEKLSRKSYASNPVLAILADIRGRSLGWRYNDMLVISSHEPPGKYRFGVCGLRVGL